MSRFVFLKSKDQKLYKLCIQVEERVNDDVDVFMLKCRRALECVVTVAGCNGRSLYEKVNDINNNLKISREMQHEIFVLKDMCNENIHFEEKAREEVDVVGTLAKLEHICHWLVDAIIDKQVKTVISDNVNVLREKMRELEDAFKRNDFEAITALNEEIKAMSTKQRDDIHVIKYGDEIDADELYKQAKQKYDEEEYEEAFKLFMESAEKGHAGAQYEIGEAYYYGEGVEKDYEEAVRWYKLAAENGNVDVQEVLGDIYCGDLETDIPLNYEEALKWYELAAKSGWTYIQEKLDALNKRIASELYEKGMEKYDKKEYEEAFKLFMVAIEKGHAGAQYKIGEAYYYGYGVEKNKEEAVKWYKLAAENGNIDAESRLVSLNNIKLTSNKNIKLHRRCKSCIFYDNQSCYNSKSEYMYKCRGVYSTACDFYVGERSECCKSCLHYDGSRCKNIKCQYYNLYRENSSKCLNYERE